MADRQTTIKEPVSLSGRGLHTGKEVIITFYPAPEGHGYKFRRTDLKPEVLVPADADYVVDTSRGTSIEFEGVRIDTIEHVLAALAGLEIDNALVELNQSETPILDGSAGIYAEKLQEAGIVEQEALRNYYRLTENVIYTNAEKRVELIAVPAKEFQMTVMIDFDSPVLPSQHATLQKLKNFKTEIAPCRTFVFLHELEHLITNNLIKGGDLDNAIVFVNRMITKAEHKNLEKALKNLSKPMVEIRKEGILNNDDLKFPNEPARHKLLDVVGDLALVGRPLKAHIIAMRPGHFSNVQFAKLIKKQIQRAEDEDAIPQFDLNKPPLFDINQIKRILPHRFPFLLIDKILEMNDTQVVGLKNVTMNEPYFTGHFPEEPVMPGVLQVEAMAQTGGIFAMSSLPDPQNYDTYFLKMENVRFRQKVVPGDTIIFVNKLVAPIRRGLCHMKGIAYVGDKIVMEAELLARIQKK